jgi:hypothetical protein
VTVTAVEADALDRPAPSRHQLPALIGLRWRMVRSPRARAGLLIALTTVPGLMLLALAAGALLPRSATTDGLLLIAPTLLLGFLVLSILTPLAAGGGLDLYPPDQLVAYPVRPTTTYWGSLVLAPLNLAWLLQVIVALAILTFIATGGLPSRLATGGTVVAYLAFATIAGHAIAWGIVGIRRSRAGRIASWVVGGALVGLVVGVVRAGRATDVLDESPTVWVVVGALSARDGGWDVWAARTGLLVLGTALALVAGRRLCRWALMRPGTSSGTVVEPTHRRWRTDVPPLAMLVRVDLLGVWRSTPLRRGALLIGLLPAAALAVTARDWSVLVLVPGLVAAGAALLFGVNAFCLDASGALWAATWPVPARLRYWARTITVALVVAGPILLATLGGTSRAGAPPTLAWLLAVPAAALACSARVTALCMRWSVAQPFRADLLGARDTPAPPGAMAVRALRLSVSTTGIGIVIAGSAAVGAPVAVLLVTALAILLSVRSLLHSRDRFVDPPTQARIVATVAGG